METNIDLELRSSIRPCYLTPHVNCQTVGINHPPNWFVEGFSQICLCLWSFVSRTFTNMKERFDLRTIKQRNTETNKKQISKPKPTNQPTKQTNHLKKQTNTTRLNAELERISAVVVRPLASSGYHPKGVELAKLCTKHLWFKPRVWMGAIHSIKLL